MNINCVPYSQHLYCKRLWFVAYTVDGCDVQYSILIWLFTFCDTFCSSNIDIIRYYIIDVKSLIHRTALWQAYGGFIVMFKNTNVNNIYMYRNISLYELLTYKNILNNYYLSTYKKYCSKHYTEIYSWTISITLLLPILS